jgi:mannose-6-phosphate isomerase-like protein (cupin superfamily)
MTGDQDERLRFGEVEILVKASADTTAGALSVFEENEPVDTPLHVHEREDELFFVLEGEHVFQVGDDEFRVGPGALVFAPRGVPHSQRRVVPRTGRILVVTAPAGLEGFFRELHAADQAGTLGPKAYATASASYGVTWLEA